MYHKFSQDQGIIGKLLMRLHEEQQNKYIKAFNNKCYLEYILIRGNYYVFFFYY